MYKLCNMLSGVYFNIRTSYRYRICAAAVFFTGVILSFFVIWACIEIDRAWTATAETPAAIIAATISGMALVIASLVLWAGFIIHLLAESGSYGINDSWESEQRRRQRDLLEDDPGN
jgi:hypothetical protein